MVCLSSGLEPLSLAGCADSVGCKASACLTSFNEALAGNPPAEVQEAPQASQVVCLLSSGSQCVEDNSSVVCRLFFPPRSCSRRSPLCLAPCTCARHSSVMFRHRWQSICVEASSIRSTKLSFAAHNLKSHPATFISGGPNPFSPYTSSSNRLNLNQNPPQININLPKHPKQN